MKMKPVKIFKMLEVSSETEKYYSSENIKMLTLPWKSQNSYDLLFYYDAVPILFYIPPSW
jgi:hypothetical protein